MSVQHYERFAISIPANMATQIQNVCRLEGRNRSEFMREAVRYYMRSHHPAISSTPVAPRMVLPSEQEERIDNPFRLFTEWESEADSVYDNLR